MSKFEITRATPAITATRVVELVPAKPGSITVTLSLKEARVIAALQGHCTGLKGEHVCTFFDALEKEPGQYELSTIIRGAITVSRGSKCIALDEVSSEINRILEGV